MSDNPLDIQVGGDHYKAGGIQPVEFIEANNLGFLEGCVIKRLTRHARPTGKGRQDIEKAIHELQLLLQLRYTPKIDATSLADSGTVRIEPTSVSFMRSPQWPNDTKWQFMAQDADGEWNAYSVAPFTLPNGVVWRAKRGSERMGLGRLDPVHGDSWTHSLIERKSDQPAQRSPRWPHDPRWQFMAQDADGRWFLYEQRPTLGNNEWTSSYPTTVVGKLDPVHGDSWKRTCVERPA